MIVIAGGGPATWLGAGLNLALRGRMENSRLPVGSRWMRKGSLTGWCDNPIRLVLALLLPASLMACSATQRADAAAMDVAATDTATKDAAATDAQVSCGITSCTVGQTYCEVRSGGHGGGAGTAETTYRCLPFPGTCRSSDCACPLGCNTCTENDSGGVTVQCLGV